MTNPQFIVLEPQPMAHLLTQIPLLLGHKSVCQCTHVRKDHTMNMDRGMYINFFIVSYLIF